MRILCMAALAATVSGCASTVPDYSPVLPMDQQQSADVSYTLLTDTLPDSAVGLDMPSGYTVSNYTGAYNYGVPGASPAAGAAGSIIAMMLIASVEASIDAARNNRIHTMLEEQGIEAEAIFNRALQERLAQSAIVVELDDRLRSGSELFQPADLEDVTSDLVIDVNVTRYGFQDLGFGGWTPVIRADVHVRSQRTGEVVMRDEVVLLSNPSGRNPADDSVVVAYDPRYTFEGVDHIVDEVPEMAASAISFGLRQTAFAIADLIQARAEGVPDTLVGTPES